jgi:voltage-gated potassium channel Kch
VGIDEHHVPRRGVWARIRYWFDSGLSRGPGVVIGWLVLLTLVVIVVAASVDNLFGFVGVDDREEGLGFVESMWQSLLRVIDPGTFAEDSEWSSRFLGLTVTLIGIFLAGSLIGLIASLVDQQVTNLRKGRSTVIESGHTLILGWSERVPVIVRELVLANESRRRTAVVVLADHDKTEMEDRLREEIDDDRSTRIVCRSGNTNLPADLEIVNVGAARSIIVTGESDASVIKTLLAVRTIDPEFRNAHVVAEVNSEDASESIRALFGPRVLTVDSDLVVAELTAQACRQRGLAAVFRELLSFHRNEIYFAPFDQLTGRTYAEAQLAFEGCSVIGLLHADGRVELNPPGATVIGAGDELVAVALDDSTFTFTGLADQRVDREPVPDHDPALIGAGRVMVVGWSEIGPRVVRELDDFVRPGTVIEVVADPKLVDPSEITASGELVNASLDVHPAAPSGPEKVAAMALDEHVSEVIVIGYRHHLDLERADARTLLTLMAFDKVARERGLAGFRVVAEVLDHRNAELALATGVDDFVVSDELASLLIGQLSERHEMSQVFDDLFRQEGNIIEFRPVSAYGVDRVGTYQDAVRLGGRTGHSVFGYQRADETDCTLNPTKSTTLDLGPDDLLLVVRRTA